MNILSKTEQQTSIDILEGELRLAASEAVRRYKAATGRIPKMIQIAVPDEPAEGAAGFEVTTVPGRLL